ncbi:hypothetical protein M9Y10_026793 [Tritrichomonas musculus]|uniref:IBB domain-containing protein n=1 Tax=Tritrichomonas musculus TaxID=1915356 RepID=A0ABR2H6R2_9EUKA
MSHGDNESTSGSSYSTKPEFLNSLKLDQNTKITFEETEAARHARQRLYGKRNANERPRVITLAQKKRLAKEEVLNTLTDSTIIDPTKVADVMANWATDDLGVDDQVSQRIFAQSLVTTQSIPNKNVFRIRIKL